MSVHHGHCTNPDCGAYGPIPAIERGWCGSCYYRWYRAGQPDTGVPPRKRVNPAPAEHAYRLDEYVHLRSNGIAPAAACRQLGLNSVDSRRRYEARWKAVA